MWVEENPKCLLLPKIMFIHTRALCKLPLNALVLFHLYVTLQFYLIWSTYWLLATHNLGCHLRYWRCRCKSWWNYGWDEQVTTCMKHFSVLRAAIFLKLILFLSRTCFAFFFFFFLKGQVWRSSCSWILSGIFILFAHTRQNKSSKYSVL